MNEFLESYIPFWVFRNIDTFKNCLIPITLINKHSVKEIEKEVKRCTDYDIKIVTCYADSISAEQEAFTTSSDRGKKQKKNVDYIAWVVEEDKQITKDTTHDDISYVRFEQISLF